MNRVTTIAITTTAALALLAWGAWFAQLIIANI
jgi:hypothetical protein